MKSLFSKEYDDYYGTSYGKSFEDEISVSPNTAQQYLYNGPDSNNSVFNFDKSNDEIDSAEKIKEEQKVTSFKFEMPEDSIQRGMMIFKIDY